MALSTASRHLWTLRLATIPKRKWFGCTTVDTNRKLTVARCSPPFARPRCPPPSSQQQQQWQQRQGKCYSTSTSINPDQIRKEIDSISEKFSEAVELMSDAKSSSGTVYFSEDMKDAELMVEETLGAYKSLRSQLNEKQDRDVQRTIGLKMEELKAQLDMLKASVKPD